MLKNLTVAKGIKEMEITGGFVAPIARLHSFFAHARFMHYHGEGCARLAAGQSVLGALSDEPTPPFWLLNLALFGRPGKSLGKLEPLIVDNVATQSLLVKFVATELSSWQTMATQCGVLITGNLAFLAVPSVIKAINDNNATQTRFLPTGGQTLKGGPPPGTHETWSLAQIFSAISTTFLLVSILVNFVLREMYNGDARDKMAEMIDLHHGQRANRGLIFRNLECLALLHSIPMAFMIWG
ncbi:hypothetical protein BC834DRAFT_80516 [Gloeopeniophorella convolvens]|nr:hypothetical protein BC834DRAFT_80516 [Gloeopeniophorella convolvens]